RTVEVHVIRIWMGKNRFVSNVDVSLDSSGVGIRLAIVVMMAVGSACFALGQNPTAFSAPGLSSDDSDSALLRLKNGRVVTDATLSLHRRTGADVKAGHYVIQLNGPLTPDRLATLSRAGIKLGQYLPNFAYIVHLPAGFDVATRLAGAGFVRW